MSVQPFQFPLNFNISQDFCLENFIAGENNELVFQLFSSENKAVYIWGESSVGKTHLLTALLNQCSQAGQRVAYIPLKQKNEFHPDMLLNMEQNDLLCLDDVDAIAGDELWEVAIFHLYNQHKISANKIVLSANANAQNIKFSLPDLSSRLQWGLTYQVKSLVDEDIIRVLQQKAQQRAFDLSDDVGLFILNHVSRDLQQLLQLLDQLDIASLSSHRKLTVRFVKKTLGIK